MKLRRADLLLIALLLLLSAGLWAWNARSGGGWAVVTVDGEEIGRYRLSEDREVPIQTERGSNLLVIRDGAAAVTEADCGDHTCVRRGTVSRRGETIVCLPHRLVVRIEGGEPPEFDGSVG